MLVALLNLVIYIIVVALVVALLLWLIDAIPLPEPFHRIARIATIAIGALIVILVLLQFAGLDAGVPRAIR